jgi:two-component system chemotaxis response regulator CheY
MDWSRRYRSVMLVKHNVLARVSGGRLNSFVTDTVRDKTVVIADGDVMSRSLLCGALRTVGLDVLDEARDGKEAWQKFYRYRPKIICLDIELPGLSGFEVLTKIREIDKAVVVVVVSALASADNVRRAIKAGADAFIGKPFTTARIKTAIERALEPQADGPPAVGTDRSSRAVPLRT